jgi:hypothetical protein
MHVKNHDKYGRPDMDIEGEFNGYILSLRCVLSLSEGVDSSLESIYSPGLVSSYIHMSLYI